MAPSTTFPVATTTILLAVGVRLAAIGLILVILSDSVASTVGAGSMLVAGTNLAAAGCIVGTIARGRR